MRWAVAVLFVSLAALGWCQGQRVVRVSVLGNGVVNREAILAAFRLGVGSEPRPDDLEEARIAVERMGYFQTVEVETLPITDGREVVIRVREYPVVEAIRFEGVRAIPEKDIQAVLGVEVGKVFNSNVLIANAAKVRDAYTRKGYFGELVGAGFKPESPRTLTVEVLEVTVNSITPYGNKRTRWEAIERLMNTKAGKPFNQDQYIADLRRLSATNWFSDLRSFSREAGPGRIDLVPAFVEAKTGEWTAGLSADPSSPVVGTFSIAERNLKGTGQSIAFKGSQGLETSGPSLEVTYGNPFLTHNNVSLGVSIYSRNSYRFAGFDAGNGEDPAGGEAFSERRTGAVVGVTKPLDENTVAQVGVRMEDVRSNSGTSAKSTGITRQNGALTSLMFGVTRNRRDLDADPSRGDWFKLGLEPGLSRITKVGGSLDGAAGIGDHAFLKSTLEYRTYWSPDARKTADDLDRPARVLALRVRYGSILGDAPFSEQFFVGGVDSVRGYAQDRFWGSHMLLGSLEYRQPLGRDVALIGFMDYGGAWGGYGGLNDFTQSRSLDMHLGYGLGIIYRMPKMGPLRLDFGFDTQGRVRTHFQIATPF